MKKILIVAVALWGSVLFLASHVSADIFDTYGFGAKGVAMGGAVCSVVDGASSVYYNPAGLAKNKGFDLDVSYFRTFPSMDISVDYPDTAAKPNTPKDDDLEFGMLTLGVALNLNMLANLPFNATFGMGLATLDDLTLAVLEDLEESQYAYLQFGAPLELITPYFGLGMEVLPDVLYVGIGGHAMISGSASANVTLITADLTTDDEDPVTPASQDIWMTMDGSIEPMFGIALKMGSLGLGFTYKEEISVDIDEFLAYLDLELGSHVARIPAALAIISNWNPKTYQLGASYQTESLTVSFDVRQENWSDFSRGPARDARTSVPEFDDVLSYHLGAEYKLMENMRGWAGYSIVPSPLPSQELASNYLANDRDIYSCGGEMQLRDPFGIAKFPIWIGGAIQYQKLKKASIHKLDGSDFYDVSHKGDVWSVVFSARVSYDATAG